MVTYWDRTDLSVALLYMMLSCFFFCHFRIWFTGSVDVFDCIDALSFLSFSPLMYLSLLSMFKMCFFLTVPWVGLSYVNMTFYGHIYLLWHRFVNII